MTQDKSAAPKVAVAIVNFNGGNLVLDCVDSVLASSIEVTVAVADNASTDGSLGALQRRFSDDQRVTIIDNSENLGFAAGSNNAFHELNPESEFVLFLNPDCRLSTDTLEQMLAQLPQRDKVGMAGCLIVNEDGSEQRGCRRNEPTPIRALSTMTGSSKQGVNQTSEKLPTEAVLVEAISGAYMLVRRAALEEVGLMDENYFLHCEDLDWCKRFRQHQWEILFVPQVVITHAKGASSYNRPVRVEWHKHRGMIRYYRKFYTGKHPFYLMWFIYLAVIGRFLLLLPGLIYKSMTS